VSAAAFFLNPEKEQRTYPLPSATSERGCLGRKFARDTAETMNEEAHEKIVKGGWAADTLGVGVGETPLELCLPPSKSLLR